MNAVLRTGSFYFLQLFQEQEGMFHKFPVTQRYARQKNLEVFPFIFNQLQLFNYLVFKMPFSIITSPGYI